MAGSGPIADWQLSSCKIAIADVAEETPRGGSRPDPVAQVRHRKRLVLTGAAVGLPQADCEQGANFERSDHQ